MKLVLCLFIASSLNVALTNVQVDRIIEILGKLIDHIPAMLSLVGTFLGLLGTAFLITKQYLNNRKVVDKLDANTKVTHEVKAVAIESNATATQAFTEANNLNLKLESMGIQTKPELGATAANPVHTITP